ncbi:parallel beta-helix domain-containing protein [Erythrobacter crassostreae]|uniref:Right-handed parallel beta-helix repeat-containing protein n=1 Tax=Erythrobacter crassostreae TaxID=2828328 RepID=A0A9X1JN83_9SPHN|nr:parallel beta-helix domain-containing protein [Erythrobacter crassostrea]MBV7259463.1 right-handed parallel beta-helix repeat-containing protein [Erythrobacter crassostrea]
MIRMTVAALAFCSAAPILAETHTVSAGEGAQERLQEALILAEPGDEVVLEAGRYTLTDGLSLDVDGVTLRGAGMDASILDFTDQAGSGEGLLVTSDNVTLRDFAVENAKGDGIKSKGADQIVYHALRVEWTNGPDASNGAYGIYPVEASNILVQDSYVRGASDAGIYVGQSENIVVRRNRVVENVAGIEIENSNHAEVTENLATKNTGGILVFDLPGLPKVGGGDVLVARNAVIDNNTDNFAPEGNIVASVPAGTGVMVMANTRVQVLENALVNNSTSHVMLIAYSQPYDDDRYQPRPVQVELRDNIYGSGGNAPDFAGGDMIAAAMGGSLPPVLTDGLHQNLGRNDQVPILTLGLTKVGQPFAEAQPSLLRPAPITSTWTNDPVVLPEEMEARLK